MKPIYKPKGKAAEYGEYAVNIYTGCSHGCYYCYSPNVLRKDRNVFHSNIEPRKDIYKETMRQLDKEQIKDRLITLCFTCDPYPRGYDSMITRDIIKLIKNSGNHVQILTKNGKDAMRDFDLLDENDKFGITYAGYDGMAHDSEYIPREEPNSGSPHYRLKALREAHKQGIFTWVSCEPVLNAQDVLTFIELADYVDSWKIGKLNYHPSDVDWEGFGKRVEAVCRSNNRNCYIKDNLREEMNK